MTTRRSFLVFPMAPGRKVRDVPARRFSAPAKRFVFQHFVRSVKEISDRTSSYPGEIVVAKNVDRFPVMPKRYRNVGYRGRTAVSNVRSDGPFRRYDRVRAFRLRRENRTTTETANNLGHGCIGREKEFTRVRLASNFRIGQNDYFKNDDNYV